MDIVITLVWILSMVVHSFSSDYALDFPNHNYRNLPLIRWGSLIVVVALSTYLVKAYKDYLEESGIWVFFIIVVVVIVLSKIAFKALVKRQR